MKRKNFTLVAFLIAIVCVGLWWFTQPAPVKVAGTATTKLATTPEGQYLIDPKSPALHPPPPPAMVPPPALPHSPHSPDSATLNTDPQADLKTAIPDMARLVRTRGAAALHLAYTAPDELAKSSPVEMQSIQSQATEVQTPQQQERNEARAQSFEALINQTPTVNAAGDEATYIYKLTQPSLTPGYRRLSSPPGTSTLV